MSINIDNYETYFLLYVDNELSAADRKAVEEFLLQHADLREEFIQLQQVVLPADEVAFEGKVNLYKSQAHDDLLQEKLLMHLDGELDIDAAAALTALLSTDDKLKADWEIFQQTKLDPAETIVFNRKDTLYRKEKDNVIIGRFVRWAIAAAVIGLGFFVSLSLFNRQINTNDGTARISNVNKNNTLSVKPLEQDSVKNNIQQQPLQTQEEKYTAHNNDNNFVKAIREKKEILKENFVNSKQKNNKIILPLPKNHNGDNDKPLMANNANQKTIENSSPEKINNAVALGVPKVPIANTTLTDTNLSAVDNSMARTAGLTDATKENNKDRILYMNEENVSRSKAGIMFRKLKRVIERNTQIKTDKGLRIGGFDLAIK